MEEEKAMKVRQNPVIVEWLAAKEALDKATAQWRKAKVALEEVARDAARELELARRAKADAKERMNKAIAAAKAQRAKWDSV